MPYAAVQVYTPFVEAIQPQRSQAERKHPTNRYLQENPAVVPLLPIIEHHPELQQHPSPVGPNWGTQSQFFEEAGNAKCTNRRSLSSLHFHKFKMQRVTAGSYFCSLKQYILTYEDNVLESTHIYILTHKQTYTHATCKHSQTYKQMYTYKHAYIHIHDKHSQTHIST